MKKTKTLLIPVEKMRPEDRGREHIPWKEMEVGGIYQRKDGRYYIYAGRAVVYHNSGAIRTRESDKHYYSYIYLDAPGVFCKVIDDDTLSILASSARIRSSEYRDIARTKIGHIKELTTQTNWNFGDFTVVIDTVQKAVGSTKRNVKYTDKQKAAYEAFVKRTSKVRKKGKSKCEDKDAQIRLGDM